MDIFGNKQQVVKVSTKHIPLRIAAFILALITAFIAFSYALTNMGIHEEGYYTIEPTTDKQTPNYMSGVDFTYHIKGASTAEMRQLNKAVTAEYSSILQFAYKTLNEDELFEGYNNIACINQNQGIELEVSDELFAILSDAFVKTNAGLGYNMFAGALYAEWENIIYSYDHEAVDPLNNEEETQRIAKIVSMTNDTDNFDLILDKEKKTVKFTVSDAYKEMMKELEIDVPVLDLNLLKYAYEMEAVRADLEAKGYTDGILTSDSGLLSGQHSLIINMEDVGSKYPLYELENGSVVIKTEQKEDTKCCMAAYRAFPMDENDLSAYTITDSEGTVHYRNMYFDTRTGYGTDLMQCEYVFGVSRDLVKAAYALIIRQACSSDEERSAVQNIPKSFAGYAVYLDK